ncbi:MAG TPA: hypothetical protein P5079_02310 [Elusimicrobiota bacterium]|nr:hypothetical protein [Elusimicrobiota bacterium]
MAEETWRVVVYRRPGCPDHRGRSAEKDWRAARLGPLKRIRTGQAYDLTGSVTAPTARALAGKLLVDAVMQEAEVRGVGAGGKSARGFCRAVIWPRQGVTDSVGETVRLGARDLRLPVPDKVRAGALFDFWGAAPRKVRRFCETHLMNDLVHRLELEKC